MKIRRASLLQAFARIVLAGTAFIRLAVAQTPKKEMAVVDLTDKTQMMKEVLQGKYIFVHDDDKMAKGEACMYVYEYSEDQAGHPEAKPEKLVVSFHCESVQREKAREIVLTYGMLSADTFELREIQFPGSTNGHRVP